MTDLPPMLAELPGLPPLPDLGDTAADEGFMSLLLAMQQGGQAPLPPVVAAAGEGQEVATGAAPVGEVGLPRFVALNKIEAPQLWEGDLLPRQAESLPHAVQARPEMVEGALPARAVAAPIPGEAPIPTRVAPVVAVPDTPVARLQPDPVVALPDMLVARLRPDPVVALPVQKAAALAAKTSPARPVAMVPDVLPVAPAIEGTVRILPVVAVEAPPIARPAALQLSTSPAAIPAEAAVAPVAVSAQVMSPQVVTPQKVRIAIANEPVAVSVPRAATVEDMLSALPLPHRLHMPSAQSTVATLQPAAADISRLIAAQIRESKGEPLAVAETPRGAGRAKEQASASALLVEMGAGPAPELAAVEAPVAPERVRGMMTAVAEPVVRELRLELTPAHLGTVTLQLLHQGQQVEASMIVAHEPARQTVQAAEQQIRELLGQQGLQLGAFEVSCRGGGEHRQPQQQTAPPLPLAEERPAAPARMVAAPRRQFVSSASGVDIYA